MRGVIRADAAEISREIVDQTAPIVIRQPILQIMQPRKIFAGALAAAITIELDVVQQPLRRPLACGLIEHAGKAERDLEERPAIHPIEIHGGRLDVVVDLERERFVARPDHGAADRRGAFSDGERFPIIRLGLLHELIELGAALKNGLKRQ